MRIITVYIVFVAVILYILLDEYCRFNIYPSSRFSEIIYILFSSRPQRLILLLRIKDSSHHLIRVLSDSYSRACIIFRFLFSETFYIIYIHIYIHNNVIWRYNSLFIHFWNGLFIFFFVFLLRTIHLSTYVQTFVKILWFLEFFYRQSRFVY